MQSEPKRLEFLNAVVEDYRLINNFDKREDDNPVDFIFQNEHSTNDLPPGMLWSEYDQENFKETHWAYDIGALNLARALAKEFKTILVYSKYSRLYVDVNRSLVSVDLHRKGGDGKIIELNQGMSIEEEFQRIQYYSTYFQALRIAFQLGKPRNIYSIHSFSSEYEGKKRNLEIGVLSSEQDEFSLSHIQPFVKKGYNCILNEPWTGNKFGNFALDCSKFQSATDHLEGVLLEVRNNLLSDQSRFPIVCQDVISVIRDKLLQRQIK